MDIKSYLKEKRELIDSYLESYFSIPSEPFVLHEAMRYSLFAGGKRIRPILALASYEACGGNPKDIVPYATALELIHTYSLIHDDLPSMDNDDLRRGKPTNHKVFGEAMAILARDALPTEAFLVLSNNPHSSSLKLSDLIKIIREVSLASGVHGMVGGQALDIFSENIEPDKDTLNFIHLHKTAALITASVRMGAILANIKEKKLKALTEYGKELGLHSRLLMISLILKEMQRNLAKLQVRI